MQGQAIPDHVLAELVKSIGLTVGPEFLAAPHKFMAELHDTQPKLFYGRNDHVSDAWMLTDLRSCFQVLRNPEVFTTRDSIQFPRDPANWFDLLPIEVDPPLHRKYRRILDDMVSMRAITEMENYISGIANDLIDEIEDKGECEFTESFGRPLPVSVFLNLMGLPQEMRDEFVSWAMGLLHSQDREIAGNALRNIAAYIKQAIDEKRRNPDDGAVSRIVHAAPDGEKLTEQEIFGFCMFLFIAGLDTVFATLNNMWVWMAENADRRREIIETMDNNLDNIVEELLRVFTVTFSGRVLTQDTELLGQTLKQGDRITCILPAANYDPDVFDDPKTVNFDRARKPMLAFAGGVHSCMGAHLARMEIKVSLREWLKRIPDFSLKPGTKITYHPGGVVGPKIVPLVW